MGKFDKGFALLKDGCYLEAKKYFDTNLESIENSRGKKEFDRRSYIQCMYGIARAWWGLDNAFAAETILWRLMEEEPGFEPSYITLGRIYESQDKIEEAREIYAKAFQQTGVGDNLLGHINAFTAEFGSLQIYMDPCFTPQFQGGKTPVKCQISAAKSNKPFRRSKHH